MQADGSILGESRWPARASHSLDLLTVLRDMDIWPVMFALQCHGPDEELLTECMQDTILACGQAGTLGLMAALLAPLTDPWIRDAVDASLRPSNAEVKQHDKERPVKTVSPAVKRRGPWASGGVPPKDRLWGH